MKTFQQFLSEGKKAKELQPIKFDKKETKKIKEKSKKIAKRVIKDARRQKQENPDKPVIANFNKIDKTTGHEKYSEPGSPERRAEIEAMLRFNKQWKKEA